MKILELFVKYTVKIDVRDIKDHTPLHEAARWSNIDDDENHSRIECIDVLLKAGADINAFTIRRESPLLIACRYGSWQLVEYLLKRDAELLHTNMYGYNCLEVAIEERNEEVVAYLIDFTSIFSLLRNAQLVQPENSELKSKNNNDENSSSSCYGVNSGRYSNSCVTRCVQLFPASLEADTPMRKLIISMPDMASKVLDKCVTTLGGERTKLHQKMFNYEFLEDQFAIRRWLGGKK